MDGFKLKKLKKLLILTHIRALVWSTLLFLHLAAAALFLSLLMRILSSSSGLQSKSFLGFRPPMFLLVWPPEEGVLFWDSSDKGGVERVSQSELDWDNELCHRLGIVSDVASEAEMYWLFPVKKYIPMLMTRASSHLRIRAWVIENIEMPICRFSNFQVWRRKNLVLIVARESNYISWTMSFRKQYSK